VLTPFQKIDSPGGVLGVTVLPTGSTISVISTLPELVDLPNSNLVWLPLVSVIESRWTANRLTPIMRLVKP
jgi:hypothetical protein